MSFFLTVASFVVAIEIARRLAIAVGAVARPNPIVKSHRKPVPYLGGTALIFGYVAVLAFSWIQGGDAPSRGAVLRAGAALAFVCFGTWDDLRPFGPRIKILVQVIICGAYLGLAGEAPGLGFALKLLALLVLVNAYNLIDVMDGLLCLLAGVAIVGLLGIPWRMPGVLVPELTALLAGLIAVFLFNCPPARIYSGDAGSLTLGFLIGSWCLAVADGAQPAHAASIIGFCAAPLLELALIIPARLQGGRSPFRGSPDHFALRLQDQLGWSKWRVLIATLVVAALFGLAPLAVANLAPPTLAAYVATCLVTGSLLWYGLWRIPPRSQV